MNRPTSTSTAVVLDLDGTLVDSVYTHVVTWIGAFGDVGLHVPGHRLHSLIGMGGDRLVAAATSEAVERAMGDTVRERQQERFAEMLPLVFPTEGAEELIEELRRLSVPVTLASSGAQEQTERLLDLVPDARSLLHEAASGSGPEASKPSGQLIERSLESVSADRVVVIGDTVWDVHAATDAGARCVGLLTGGVARERLLEAGAVSVHPTPGDLAAHLRVGHDLTDPPSDSDQTELP